MSKSIKLLLVEDDENDYIIMKSVVSQIKYENYTIDWASTYDKAIDIITSEENHFDVIFMDYNLGRYNGIELMREIKEKGCNIPIIVLTGQDDREVDVSAMENGATDYIEKSKLDADGLERAIRYAMARKKSEEKIFYLAYYDNLTHLPNRFLFMEKLNQAILSNKRSERNLAIFFIDIDNFKKYNDTLGHRFGDVLLKEVSKKLLKCIRVSDCVARDSINPATDIVARLGGDEFTILLTEISHSANSSIVADRIQKEFEKEIVIDNKVLPITLSMGIAIYPYDGRTQDDLLKNADIAMYNAKKEGKNTYRYYKNSSYEKQNYNLLLEFDLRNAIKNNEFVVYYQPIVNMDTEKIIYMEALARWQHPKYGIVSPEDFINLAENIGIIDKVGDCIFEKICKDYQEMNRSGVSLVPISVNISPKQFDNPQLFEQIKNKLENYKIPSSSIIIEITETCVFSSRIKDSITEIVNKYKEYGIKISLDDFGTGYSSLKILQFLPIDFIKIDGSFTKNILESKKNQAIIDAILILAEKLDISVIPEGIEIKEQIEYLKSKECKNAQGFYYYKPLPLEKIKELLQEDFTS
ncbi:EAL domain-containing protein [Herbivorax sp. ANBcel31]|uniref:GGDEF domain-containing response regulator n=1 Tax=Herbivorax sp. ANBcel31 TaxID=3069754 RepID=UPI0027B6049B|nr:GGDEF domain-containing response regulator [Herbivorax sp. ANBcel31]MDQ2085070.1 EAL domain-containing protein [Herbivorax sp. ANBcel31]